MEEYESHSESNEQLKAEIAELKKKLSLASRRNKLKSHGKKNVEVIGENEVISSQLNNPAEKIPTHRQIHTNSQSEQLYRNIIESTSAVAWEVDLISMKFIYISPKIFELSGYHSKLWIDYDYWAKRIHPEDRKDAVSYCEVETAKGHDHSFEYRLIAKNGKIKWIRDLVNVIWENAHPTKLRGYFLDITSLKEMEIALRKSEEKYRLLFDLLPYGSEVININGKIEQCSPRTAEMLGYTNNELIGKHITELLCPDSVKIFREKFPVLLSGKSAMADICMIRKDGTLLNVLRAANPIFDSNGKVEAILAVNVDITERLKSERALQESESRYRSIVKQAAEGIVLYDVDTKCILEANNTYQKMLGYTEDEMYTLKLYDIVAHDRESIDNFIKRIKAEEQVNIGKRKHRCKDGSLIDVEVSSSLIFVSGKESLLTVVHDITERNQAEEALRKHEKIVSSSTDMLAYLDKNCVFKTTNKAFQEAFDLTPEKLTELSPADVFGNEYFEESFRLNVAQCLAGEHINFRRWVEFPKLGNLFMDINYYPYTNQNGKVEGFVVNARNITKRKEAENELVKSEGRLRAITEFVSDTIIQSDRFGKINYINRLFEDLTMEQVLSSTVYDYVTHEQRPVIENALTIVFEKCENTTYEISVKRPDGKLREYFVKVSPVFSESEVSFAVFLVSDITERKLAEEENLKLEKRLARARKLETIGTLAGGIAHDFNNILTPILGYSDLILSNEEISDSLRNDLECIFEASNRAKELVRQILLFGKQVSTKRKPIDASLVIKEAIKLLRPSIPSTIEIRKEISSSCDMVLANSAQIHQVIVNLCTNAWHSMEGGSGIISIKMEQIKADPKFVELHPNLKEEEYVCLTVNDTGPGMKDSVKERIFEPFFTTKAVNKGTGMGLSVVHGIIHDHKGEIYIHSEQGNGTEVNIYLPITKIEEESHAEDIKPSSQNCESILLVDDDKIITNMLTQMLRKFGYKVDSFISSVKAEGAFMQNPEKYDLLISDLTMPEKTGLEITMQVRKSRPGFPVIIITGYGDKLNAETQKKYGINRVLSKPVITNDLALAVRGVLDS